MVENNEDSRITAGGIENLVNPSEVRREGYGQVYELFRKKKGNKDKSEREFYIELDVGSCFSEGRWVEVNFPRVAPPSLERLNKFLKEKGIFLAHARMGVGNEQLEVVFTGSDGGNDSKTYYLGLADVYVLNKDRKNKYIARSKVPDFLPQEIR